jgi:hypothetical protein
MTTMATWIVWSPLPPERLEKISCSSMLDAVRAWAERQHRAGMTPRDGMEVLVHCETDASPRLSMCRAKIRVAMQPTFRAVFAGLAFEGEQQGPNGAKRGQ